MESIELAIAPGAKIKFPDINPKGILTENEEEDCGETVRVAIAPGVEMDFPALDLSDVE